MHPSTITNLILLLSYAGELLAFSGIRYRNFNMEKISSRLFAYPGFSRDEPIRKNDELQRRMQQYKSNPNGKRVFDDTLQFPVKFEVKVIGLNDRTFAVDMVNIICSIVGTSPEETAVNLRETSGGKYIAVSVTPTFNCANELYDAYEAISRDSRVKFML